MNQQLQLDPRTLDTVRQMIGLAQQGGLIAARNVGKSALANGVGQPGPVNALLGRMACESGDFDDGIDQLRQAIALLPDETAVRTDLVAALIQVGDFDAALAICPMDRCASDPTLQLARFRGYAAQQLERYGDAIDAYQLVVDRAPDDAGTWNNLGNAQAGAGLADAAVESLGRAVALDPNAPPSRINLAAALAQVGRGDDAIQELKKATADFPREANAFFELGRLAGSQGNTRLAVDSLERANQLRPNDAEILTTLAGQRGVDWDLEGAIAAYREALGLQPDKPEALIGLAMIYEQNNNGDSIAAVAEQARTVGVEPGVQSFIDALQFRREKRWEEGLAAAEAATAEYDAIRRAQLIGEFNDRLHRPAEAFAAFDEMNRLAAESPHGPATLAKIYRDMATTNAATMTREWLATWSDATAPGSDERRSPVFLLGFPRSGTTLLDTMLMGHPDVRVLEEKPPLTHVEQSIGNLGQFPTMSADDIRSARARYWEEVGTFVDLPGGATVVDKSPLYLNKTAIIHRLFPDARFILALRHPMDVVLSCYVTNFRPNAAMSNFMDLKQTAELYDRSMSAFFAARELLQLPTFTVVYERMIEDQEGELRPLFDWLGLDWRRDAVDHLATAAKRGTITTASYAQVNEPLYKRSAGRWVRYREQLEPVQATLAPWIERFGYSLEQPEMVPER